MTRKTIKIEGMSCQHCANRVEQVLNTDEVSAKVDLANNTAVVESESAISDEDLKKRIEFAGYKVVEIK
jgi:copper chaperone